MIEILGTTRDEFLSKMIRKVTKEPISHVAIRVGDMVIHSNRHGVHYQTYSFFEQDNIIIKRLKLKSSLEESLLEEHIKERSWEYEGKQYDFTVLLYLGIRLALRNYLNIPLEKDNLWDVSNMYICTELVGDLTGFRENEMLTPDGLLKEMIKTGKWLQIRD